MLSSECFERFAGRSYGSMLAGIGACDWTTKPPLPHPPAQTCFGMTHEASTGRAEKHHQRPKNTKTQHNQTTQDGNPAQILCGCRTALCIHTGSWDKERPHYDKSVFVSMSVSPRFHGVVFILINDTPMKDGACCNGENALYVP